MPLADNVQGSEKQIIQYQSAHTCYSWPRQSCGIHESTTSSSLHLTIPYQAIMALLQSLNLEHLPSTYTVHIALYREIRNAAFLHQQLLAGNTDFEYALIDASIVSLHSIASLYSIYSPWYSNQGRK